ncbi:glycogen synthase GlgA [Aestuariivirga sp.]|uniref:glycogen synthase GlgA n=1 Tax=Aestuariivirga sp. TaxID=2650926 RepID=UPI0025C1AE6D|nr:glycogen synthase GlgA [Aestuariivirga sp.]MCA3555987.1 glycogen synthase GlgA [Aestuariivirga sp.]
MKVLSAASELFPLVKTGGLADVTGALPAALAGEGVEVTNIVPGYPAVMAALEKASPFHAYGDLFGGPARLMRGTARGLDIIAIDAPHLFDRPGNPYLGTDGKDWPDNARRFAALAKAAADVAGGINANYRAGVLHCHDWQAALGPVYSRFMGGPKSVMTVHNIAFQGQFPATVFGILGLPQQAFAIDGVEYYGNVGYLKGGLAAADAITTVSPTYAQEICTPEHGMGLDGLLRARRQALRGIVNGIDTDVWNPAMDGRIPQTYAAGSLTKRAANKRALEKTFRLEPGDGIIHGVVSRLTWQKGMDIFAAGLDALAAAGARLALLGTGETAIENAVLEASVRHPGRIGVITGHDEDIAHLVQAGADTILVPSRFEPCGLTQLCGLRYGCVPVVARTGGLNDTVIDANDAALRAGVATGFQFAPVDGAALEHALARAAECHSDPQLWQGLQRRGMEQDVSWSRSAAAYARLHRSLVKA